ncbi:hypothetical protein J4480_02965 [Candidatus Woesearchaeota archaeon]|nr:hypothetical protein [Candidatus Woesearchaeota archaeon]
MTKKSQISFFIIAGILVFITFSFLSYLNDLESEKAKTEPKTMYFGMAPVKNFVESCLKEKSLEALDFTGSKGGYYNDPDFGADYLYRRVPYYYHMGGNLTPTIGFVEESVSDYIEDSISLCINDFMAFPGFEISGGEINADALLSGDKSVFRLNYPIAVKQGNSTANLEDFAVELPVRFIGLYNAGLQITGLQIEDPNNICLSCLTDIAIKNNVSISLENYNEDTILFKLALNTTIQDYEAMQLVFANKYLIK